MKIIHNNIALNIDDEEYWELHDILEKFLENVQDDPPENIYPKAYEEAVQSLWTAILNYHKLE